MIIANSFPFEQVYDTARVIEQSSGMEIYS